MPEGLAPAAKGEPPLRTRGGAQARKMPPGAARSGRECGERAQPCPLRGRPIQGPLRGFRCSAGHSWRVQIAAPGHDPPRPNGGFVVPEVSRAGRELAAEACSSGLSYLRGRRGLTVASLSLLCEDAAELLILGRDVAGPCRRPLPRPSTTRTSSPPSSSPAIAHLTRSLGLYPLRPGRSAMCSRYSLRTAWVTASLLRAQIRDAKQSRQAWPDRISDFHRVRWCLGTSSGRMMLRPHSAIVRLSSKPRSRW